MREAVTVTVPHFKNCWLLFSTECYTSFAQNMDSLCLSDIHSFVRNSVVLVSLVLYN